MSKKLNQKGFTLVEGLLAVIAIALVGFVGFYVFNANKKADDTYSSASKVVSSDAQSKKTNNSSKKSSASQVSAKDELKVFVIASCSQSDLPAISNLFDGKTQQTAETDNYALEGDYAIVNVPCTLVSNGYQMNTLLAKKTNGVWGLLLDKPVGVDCGYLTSQGVPDKLKAPYCQNQ